MPIDHQAYRPLSLSTIEPIDHRAYRPSSLSTIEPIDHRDYRPSSLSTIKPIDHQAYQPSSLSTIKPINIWSSFATFNPFGLLFLKASLKLMTMFWLPLVGSHFHQTPPPVVYRRLKMVRIIAGCWSSVGNRH